MAVSAARVLARVFREQFQMHLAWIPATSSVALGDYGLWRDALFTPLGNIAEFGVPIRRVPGQETRLSYTSQVATSGMGALGGSIAGKRGDVHFRFARAGGCVVRVARLKSERIGNLAEVARGLSRCRAWRWRYKIVSELFTGEDVLILVTSERDTELALSGDFRSLAGQSVGADVEVVASKRLGLEIVGGSGPIGLNACRLRVGGGLALSFDMATSDVVCSEEQVPALVAEDVADEPLDDITHQP